VNSSARERLAALEGAVQALLSRVAEAEASRAEAQARRDEVEGLLREMSEGDADPAEMAKRLEALEAENEELRHRIDEGLAGVDRLLARIRFLENQR
jgi:chromosome segregation ATPase